MILGSGGVAHALHINSNGEDSGSDRLLEVVQRVFDSVRLMRPAMPFLLGSIVMLGSRFRRRRAADGPRRLDHSGLITRESCPPRLALAAGGHPDRHPLRSDASLHVPCRTAVRARAVPRHRRARDRSWTLSLLAQPDVALRRSGLEGPVLLYAFALGSERIRQSRACGRVPELRDPCADLGAEPCRCVLLSWSASPDVLAGADHLEAPRRGLDCSRGVGDDRVENPAGLRSSISTTSPCCNRPACSRGRRGDSPRLGSAEHPIALAALFVIVDRWRCISRFESVGGGGPLW